MARKRNPVNYVEYSRGGIRLLLPDFLKIKGDPPQFYATGKKASRSLLILLDEDPLGREMWEAMLRQKNFSNDQLESRIVREGEVNIPFNGFERIVEHRVINHPTGNVSYGWGLALYAGDQFVKVHLSAFVPFTAEEEAVWRPVLDSLEIVEGWHEPERVIDDNAMQRDLQIFADYNQFYLWDAGKNPLAPTDYTEEIVKRRIHVAAHVVVIQPERNTTVPVRVEVHNHEPSCNPGRWDHIAEASLHIPTGQLQLHECTGGPVADFSVAPGWYRVRAFYGNLAGAAAVDEEDARDHYLVVLWPGPAVDVRVLKQWLGAPSD